MNYKNYKFFIPTPSTIEELKALYRKLALKYHPDLGGNTADMQAINNEYDCLFDEVKSFRRNAKGEVYEKETAEAPEHFRYIINALIKLKMESVLIELIGSFLWLSGNTKPYKDEIKELGFKWSQNKSSWYLAPDGYRKRSRKDYSMNDIRNMYGSANVQTNSQDDSERRAIPA